jgi:hypothetical protein
MNVFAKTDCSGRTVCVHIDGPTSAMGKETSFTAKVWEVNPEIKKITASLLLPRHCLPF